VNPRPQAIPPRLATISATGAASITNVSTAPFPASTAGNSDINATVSLPHRYIAPIVFVFGAPNVGWFAASGAEPAVPSGRPRARWRFAVLLAALVGIFTAARYANPLDYTGPTTTASDPAATATSGHRPGAGGSPLPVRSPHRPPPNCELCRRSAIRRSKGSDFDGIFTPGAPFLTPPMRPAQAGMPSVEGD